MSRVPEKPLPAIQSPPYTEEEIDESMKKSSHLLVLNSTEVQNINEFLARLLEEFPAVEVVYIRRYPVDQKTLIGVKEPVRLNYFS